MKKKLVGLLAALMVLSMGTTVFAAGSASAGANGSAQTKAINKTEVKTADKITSVKIDTITEGKVTKFEIAALSVNDEKAAKDEVLEKFGTTGEILGMFDLVLEGVTKATITFDVTGVKAGEHIYCLHQKADGKWEQPEVTNVADGKVTVKFENGFSPVVLVKGDPVQTGSTSPVVAVLAMICLAGVVVCGKKVKFNA